MLAVLPDAKLRMLQRKAKHFAVAGPSHLWKAKGAYVLQLCRYCCELHFVRSMTNFPYFKHTLKNPHVSFKTELMEYGKITLRVHPKLLIMPDDIQ